MVVIVLILAAVFGAGTLRFGDELNREPVPYDDDSALSGNPMSGSPGDLVRISNTQAGATDVTYRVNFTIREGSDTIGNSLNSVYLEVTTSPAPDLFSETAFADLVRVGVDENTTGSIDREITGDANGWTVKNGGAALKIEFSGSAYTPTANDSIIVIFEGANNPDSAGDYDLRAETSGDGNWYYGTISITESGQIGVVWTSTRTTISLQGLRRPAVIVAQDRVSLPFRPGYVSRREVEARRSFRAGRDDRSRFRRLHE
jgi:hypothetical protein